MLKNNKFDAYLSFFDENFMENNKRFIAEIFAKGLKLLKVNDTNNIQIWAFFNNFQKAVFKIKGDQTTCFFIERMKESFDISKLEIAEIEEFLNKFNNNKGTDIKNFLFEVLVAQNQDLKNENKSLKKKNNDFKKELKVLTNSSSATNLKIKLKKTHVDDKTRKECNFIKNNFPKFRKKLIFDSSRHSDMNSIINGKQNLVIFMESNLIFGGYFSFPFPIYQDTNHCQWKDPDCCIFEVTKKIRCNAHPAAARHLETHEKFFFRLLY